MRPSSGWRWSPAVHVQDWFEPIISTDLFKKIKKVFKFFFIIALNYMNNFLKLSVEAEFGLVFVPGCTELIWTNYLNWFIKRKVLFKYFFDEATPIQLQEIVKPSVKVKLPTCKLQVLFFRCHYVYNFIAVPLSKKANK